MLALTGRRVADMVISYKICLDADDEEVRGSDVGGGGWEGW